MTTEELEEITFKLVSQTETARTLFYQALAAAEAGQQKEADTSYQLAKENFDEAHKLQTLLIQREVSGEAIPFSLLLLHAEDHVISLSSEQTLIAKLITCHQKMNHLGQRLARLEQHIAILPPPPHTAL